jgi:hypothetical protein
VISDSRMGNHDPLNATQIVAAFSRMIAGKADMQPSSGNGQATYKLTREKPALHIRRNVSESRKSLPVPRMGRRRPARISAA